MDIVVVIELVVDYLIKILQSLGYWGTFLAMFFESACIPISSEVVLLFAGFLVRKGAFSLWGMATAGAAGFALGALLPYFLGRKYGEQLIGMGGRLLFTSEEELQRVWGWFTKYGEFAILFTRFVPVVRDFISIPAGSAKMSVGKFLLYSFLGILPWTLFVVWVGSLLGAHWHQVIELFAASNSIVLWAIVVAVVLLFVRRLHSAYCKKYRKW